MTDDPYAAWRCKDCTQEYPVPGLARDCEARHAAQLAALYDETPEG